MVPSDNIFNIYYDIGRALPFEVQRFPKDATDWYKNQSVLVTEIHTRGKYGEALGFYLRVGPSLRPQRPHRSRMVCRTRPQDHCLYAGEAGAGTDV